MKFRQALFWDVNPNEIDLDKNATYIIERVLEMGNDDEVRWLWGNYSKKKLKEIVNESRSINPRTKSLWTLMLKSK